MKSRLVILLILLAGVGVAWFAIPKPDPDETPKTLPEDGTQEYMRLLALRDLPGEEPDIPPDLTITVEVDEISGKDGLIFTISEANGYYVETFEIDFWYSEEGRDGERLIDEGHYENNYIKANETLTFSIQVVPAELDHIDGTMGDPENWYAEIISHGRARTENPVPLPPLTREESEAIKGK